MNRPRKLLLLLASLQLTIAGPRRTDAFTQFVNQQDRMNLKSTDSIVSLATDVLCYINNDCIDTTFCCSNYSCVHPDKCLYGEKE